MATDPATASSLLGIGAPPMRAQSSWWFASPVSPTSLKTAFVNPLGPAGGPISHAMVVSNIAPRYAPSAQHLVAACSVPVPGTEVGAETEAEVRAQLGQHLPHRHRLLGPGRPAGLPGILAGGPAADAQRPRGGPG